jgi:hypothetical protein
LSAATASTSITVKIDLNANRIHDGEYDPLPAHPDACAKGLVQPETNAKA